MKHDEPLKHDLLNRTWFAGDIPDHTPQPEGYGWIVCETGRADPDDAAQWDAESAERAKLREYGYRPFELQADHDSDLFTDVHGSRDDLAHRDCVDRALAGDQICAIILEWLKRYSNAEYVAIIATYAQTRTNQIPGMGPPLHGLNSVTDALIGTVSDNDAFTSRKLDPAGDSQCHPPKSCSPNVPRADHAWSPGKPGAPGAPAPTALPRPAATGRRTGILPSRNS